RLRARHPGYLLWLGRALGFPPASVHETAVKSLKAAYDAFEPGSLKRREAALALCDLLTDVYDKPDEASKLIEEVAGQKDTLALSRGWELSLDRAYYPVLGRINAEEVSGKLTWEEIPATGFGERSQEKPWLRRSLNLDGRDNGKPLFLDLGSMYPHGMIWFNNRPVCAPWECMAGILAVPPQMLKRGVNELLIHFQPLGHKPHECYYSFSGPGTDHLARQFRLAKARALLAVGKMDEAGALLKKEVLRQELARAQPKSFIVGWHMLGPFGHRRSPDTGSANVDLDKDWDGKKWKPVEDMYYRGVGLDIRALVPERKEILLYRQFSAEQAFDSQFIGQPFFGSLAVAVNGQYVIGHIGRRGRWRGGGVYPVKMGKNEIFARVRVTDPKRTGTLVLSMTNPIGEAAEMSLASHLRKAKLWANDGNPDHADAAYDFLGEILNREPTQHMNMDVMETMVRALIGRQDYKRALVLSGRLLRRNPREVYERALLWGQVQIRLGLGELDKARGLFKRLNRDFPYSEETLKAREAIIKWYKEAKKRKEGAGKE
ncbi:MAG: tetratricopeptide repeat protein, partial [Planctomycetota bacterium]